MKRIHLMAVKLLRNENADPAESFLPYTNKRPWQKYSAKNCVITSDRKTVFGGRETNSQILFDDSTFKDTALHDILISENTTFTSNRLIF